MASDIKPADIRVGLRVGRRVVLKCDKRVKFRSKVVILCDCGRESVVDAQTLIYRPEAGCEQCSRAEVARRLQAAHQAELARQYPLGWRLGSRVVVGVPFPQKPRKWAIPMRCDCGGVADVALEAVSRGQSGMCLKCRNENAGEFVRAKIEERKVESVREQLEAPLTPADLVCRDHAKLFLFREFAEINTKTGLIASPTVSLPLVRPCPDCGEPLKPHLAICACGWRAKKEHQCNAKIG